MPYCVVCMSHQTQFMALHPPESMPTGPNDRKPLHSVCVTCCRDIANRGQSCPICRTPLLIDESSVVHEARDVCSQMFAVLDENGVVMPRFCAANKRQGEDYCGSHGAPRLVEPVHQAYQAPIHPEVAPAPQPYQASINPNVASIPQTPIGGDFTNEGLALLHQSSPSNQSLTEEQKTLARMAIRRAARKLGRQPLAEEARSIVGRIINGVRALSTLDNLDDL